MLGEQLGRKDEFKLYRKGGATLDPVDPGPYHERDEFTLWELPNGDIVPHGDAIRYSQRGGILMEGNFFYGRRDGEWVYRDSNGRITCRERWSRGELLDWEGTLPTGYGGFGLVAGSVPTTVYIGAHEYELELFCEPRAGNSSARITPESGVAATLSKSVAETVAKEYQYLVPSEVAERVASGAMWDLIRRTVTVGEIRPPVIRADLRLVQRQATSPTDE